MKKTTINTSFLLLIALGISIGLYSCNSQDKKPYKDPLDLSARDTTVSPAQNFFEYANGTWVKNTKIPADMRAWGSFYIARKRLNQEVKKILDSCSAIINPQEGTPAQQIGDLYASAMDSNAINQAGLTLLKADLARIQAIKKVNGIILEVGKEYTEGDWNWKWYHDVFSRFKVGQLFTLYAFTDAKNSEVVKIYCNQGGLGLPNKTYYFNTDSSGKAIISAYKKYIAQILELSGDSAKAQSDAEAIFSLEKKLAQASKSPVELMNIGANYHLMTLSNLNKLTPNINWIQLFSKMGIQQDTVIVGQPKFFKALSGLLKNEPISLWKKYLTFHLINRYAPWLSQPYSESNFIFYERTLQGLQKQKARWKRAAALINNSLGDALGQIYVKRYFPPSAKAYMEKMVNNIEAAYRVHIKNLTWMSDSTKAKALDKLNAVVKKIGYPDHWKDYSSIEINRKSLIGNLKRIGQWYYQYDMAKLNKPVDRSEWFMTPATVNAYYNPFSNDINFPAGILQPPFYFQNADDAINYGGIGMLIGHEITHGFDNHGSKFDKNGNLKNWWTKEDRKKFDKRAEGIVKQYNAYTVLDTLHLNGKLEETENIADVGGVSIAYSAFKNTKEGQSDTLINGLTPDQRFFLSFAQIWRIKVRPQFITFLIHSDPHAPAKWRVNGPLSNMPAFYKAFNVKQGDKMYRADSVRVKIW